MTTVPSAPDRAGTMRQNVYDACIVFGGLTLALVSIWVPDWVRFTLQMSIGIGLATLGLVLLMRCGLISLGQGLYYCIGGYSVAYTQIYLGTSDIFVALLVCIVVSTIFSLIVIPVIRRYREIFFAMLTLALSMIVYGILIKGRFSGGSDGLNISPPTFLGLEPTGQTARTVMFVFSILTATAAMYLCRRFMNSDFGVVSRALKGNELRVEYLGYSPNTIVTVNYCLAAVLASVGGLIAAAGARHVDPFFSYWTTSAEFVFAALIGGHLSVFSAFVGAIVLEVLRIVGQEIAPGNWQMVLGVAMLVIILVAPRGIVDVVQKLRLGKRKNEDT